MPHHVHWRDVSLGHFASYKYRYTQTVITPPKLVMAALESIFRRLTWETRGWKIDGEYHSHLRFADDILRWVNTPYELQQMLQKLDDESKNQRLKMNKSKTKEMMRDGTPTYVNNTPIENVKSDNFLAQRYSTRDKN